MRKAKIMLMAIAVVAVTGGVLAFKANTHFVLATMATICYTDYDQILGCGNNLQLVYNVTVDPADPDDATICYTTTDEDECPETTNLILGKNFRD